MRKQLLSATCADSGPWTCAEEGCPAEVLGCASLAGRGTCKLTFGMMWKDAPIGTNNSRVETMCPVSCGMCPVHPEWRGKTAALRRYQSFSLDERKQMEQPDIVDADHGPALKLTRRRFEEHLVTAEPFIVTMADGPPPRFDSLDSFSAALNKTWRGEVMVLDGRLSKQAKLACHRWQETGHKLHFGSFRKFRESFPGVYMSIVSRSNAEHAFLRSMSPPLPFVPDHVEREPYWMYAGGRGAGASEHIDSVGCVCSWSYMLFGSKRWLLRTPPGLREAEARYSVLQNTGDFFFWCVGYYHATVIESHEALDVHGYFHLDAKTAGSYARMVPLISHEDLRAHTANDEEVRKMNLLRADCKKAHHQAVSCANPQFHRRYTWSGPQSIEPAKQPKCGMGVLYERSSV